MPNKRASGSSAGRGRGGSISSHFQPKASNAEPVQNSTGKISRSALKKNQQVQQLLQATDGYEPKPAEVAAAERVYELECTLKNSKIQDQSETELKYKKALDALNKMITTRMATSSEGKNPVIIEETTVVQETLEMEIDDKKEPAIETTEREEPSEGESPAKKMKNTNITAMEIDDEAIIVGVKEINVQPEHKELNKEKEIGDERTLQGTKKIEITETTTTAMDIDEEATIVEVRAPVELTAKVTTEHTDEKKEKTTGEPVILKTTPTSDKSKNENLPSGKANSSTVANPYDKKAEPTNQWKGKSSLSEALKGEKTLKEKRSNEIRVRVRYEAAQKDGHEITLNMEGHKALKAAQIHINKTDPEAEILQWKENTEKTAVNNVLALTPKESMKYIGLPYNRKNIGMGRVEIGIRIATNLTLDQFLDASGRHRKEKKVWMFTRAAEMQQSHEAHAVGFCVGSSPKKFLNLLNERLTGALGLEGKTRVEASWQMISSGSIGKKFSDAMWKNAYKKRDEASSGASRGLTFNLYTPSALVIYVADPKYKKHVKMELTKNFGGGKKVSSWNEWPDGSRMRFIPYFLPTSALRVREKVAAMAEYQIHSRVHETVRDLEVSDIFSKQKYLEGKTLHEAILNLESGKNDGSFVFKQIMRKWTPNYLDTYYQVSSFSSKTEEANLTAESLMAIMVEKYGSEVARHFPNGSYHTTTEYKKHTKEEDDPELAKLFGDSNFGTENILEPGWVSTIEYREAGLLTTEEPPEGESTIHLSEPSIEITTTAPSTQQSTNTFNSSNATPKFQSDSVSLLTGDNSAAGVDADDDDTVVTYNTDKSTSPEKSWKNKKITVRTRKTEFTEQQIEVWTNANRVIVDKLKIIYKADTAALNKAVSSLMEEEVKNLPKLVQQVRFSPVSDTITETNTNQPQGPGQAPPHP